MEKVIQALLFAPSHNTEVKQHLMKLKQQIKNK